MPYATPSRLARLWAGVVAAPPGSHASAKTPPPISRMPRMAMGPGRSPKRASGPLGQEVPDGVEEARGQDQRQSVEGHVLALTPLFRLQVALCYTRRRPGAEALDRTAALSAP